MIERLLLLEERERLAEEAAKIAEEERWAREEEAERDRLERKRLGQAKVLRLKFLLLVLHYYMLCVSLHSGSNYN